MTQAAEPNVSVSWNGVQYTGHASDGTKFGTATGGTEDEARSEAIKALAKSPEKDAPQGGVPGSPAVVK